MQANFISNSTIDIPANSIMTLVGDNSLPEIPTANEDAIAFESNLKLQVYPNPSQGGFYIQGNKLSEGVLKVKLLNLQGVEIQSINYPNDATEMYISTENLTNGIYMLKYNNQYQKVVVNK